LFYGNKDGPVPPEFGEAYHPAFLASRLVVLENAGHAPFDEQNSAFLATFPVFVAP
jgi:pimeloyl-ACP methyl ester carboxylesterase